MASLTEVYRGSDGAGLRRLYAGVVLFGIGAILVTTGLVVASTGLGSAFGLGQYQSRELAGVLGGLGFPAVLLGTMVALPRSSRELQLAAGVGAVLSLIAVGMFVRWYPVDWIGGSGNSTMTFVVSATYFVGAIVTSWCLFTAVANFKARNDPGGTISLEITKEGETRVVEVSSDDLRSRLGGIGMLGGTPDGEAKTQTNRENRNVKSSSKNNGGSSSADRSPNKSRSRSRSRSSARAGANPTDGGADRGASIRDPGITDDAEFLDDGPKTPINDSYCGNCAYFRYVRTDEGLVPYCGLHSETMDDMDACDEWSSNTM
jgi:hypothetical protein